MGDGDRRPALQDVLNTPQRHMQAHRGERRSQQVNEFDGSPRRRRVVHYPNTENMLAPHLYPVVMRQYGPPPEEASSSRSTRVPTANPDLSSFCSVLDLVSNLFSVRTIC